MSLAGFQRALAQIATSPDNCFSVRSDPNAFKAEHALTDLELRRILHCLNHRGMRVCWSLYRANRLGPINAILPLTCAALGNNLRGLLENFWNASLPKDLQFVSEGHRFALFLRWELAKPTNIHPAISDVIDLELAVADLRFDPHIHSSTSQADDSLYCLHPMIRLVPFHYDPELVIEPLTHDLPLAPNLPRGDFAVIVDARFGPVEIKKAPVHLLRTLQRFVQPVSCLDNCADLQFLVQTEFLVRVGARRTNGLPSMKDPAAPPPITV